MADLVRARGAGLERVLFGPRRDLAGAVGAVVPAGVDGRDGDALDATGKFLLPSEMVSSSSSTPNESFPFAWAGFRFFFGRSMGVAALYFGH